ncbi:peptide ABC transporter substrate-binding protein [Liquorilactobacillus satsumensis]|nr:peptide ABC transporter substrate-binding protein [Liquorilactobacillus satsumensis]MCC7666798.1 peptide ABC transporter substrate-binding protein [Liquorilactobacillus satsumensis]MCP9311997.1 peptide ABC transporter substrate-binding protein [Liquorilactobacillus satsumensis]MCP9358386.1 peptide ABC transporter substrate-binding protein [Liquorilactobacillus satsumensis]MCP9359131.1 peptide ABC transporter substrate-binding protein [Liquorilactobacillus satsumensis]MCP9372309.1 peptide AB
MNWKKFLSASLVVTASGLLLASCGSAKSSAQTASKQVLRWSEPSEMQTLDPSKVVDTVSSDMISNSNEGLYRLGKNSKVQPGIATKVKVSDNGLKYTFTLRKNSKWSNGDPVTAADFVYSWRRTVAPKTASEYAYIFEGIKNAAAITAGQKPVSDLGVQAVGKYQLVVTLERNIPYFKLLMGFTPFFPQNQRAVEKYGSKYGTAAKYMVYNGPYKMTGWSGSNLKWNLVKNNQYWDKKHVKLTDISFQVTKSPTTSYNLYQDNKLDETYLNAEQAKQLNTNKEYVSLKQARTTYLEFNQTKKEFQNKKIREALSYAVNRQQLVNKVLGNGSLPAKSIVSKDLALHNGKDFADTAATTAGVTYNKEKAQKLWKEGLQELGVKSLSFSLLGDDDDVSKSVSTYLQSQLETNLPGAQVSVLNLPKKTRITRSTTGQFDVVISGWAADFSDPISFLDLFTKDNSYNFGKWSNAQYDKLVTASKTTDVNHDTQRWNDLVQAAKLLSTEQGVAPLYQVAQAQMLKSKVKGVVYNTAGVAFNFKNAYVTQ